MKNKNFTYLFGAILILCASMTSKAQDTGTGTGWASLNPTSSLVLEENFQGFTFFGNWQHANNSNSKPYTDETTLEEIRGTQEGSLDTTFLNSTATVSYTWDSCAFAPEWGVSKSVDGDGVAVDPNPTTEGVSDGFVEIARNGYGTLAGHFIVDLRNLDYVEAIQYSHSSCGGKRRGFMLLYSLDDAASWDTLRFQSGDHYSLNYTKDTFTGDKSTATSNYNCDPSAYGMLWEDGVYAENLMLKFMCDNLENQAVRLHDLKVYGDLPVSAQRIVNEMDVKVLNNQVVLSEKADVEIYSITGTRVISAKNVSALAIDGIKPGIYLLSAKGLKQGQLVTQKFVIK